MAGERIVGVAIRRRDGLILSLPAPHRHGCLFRRIWHFAMRAVWPQRSEQGFTTSEGRFVGRTEGRRIAEASGQFKRDGGCTLNELFSEDLW